jgi:hypothetical protein
MMPATARPLNLDPALPILAHTLSDAHLLPVLKTLVDCIDSGPLVSVSLVSLKNAAYVYFGDRPIVAEFDNAMSCRLRYAETAVTSLAAFVYNFAFGLIFSVLSAATLGKIKIIVDHMRRNWIQTAIAAGAFGVSCIGAFSPEMGIKANLAAGFALGLGLMQTMQGDVIGKICASYQRNRQEIAAAVRRACGDSNVDFNEFTPLFNHLNEHLHARVQTVSELMSVLQNARSHLPHVLPWASPVAVVNMLQQLAITAREEPVAGVSSNH